jgi:hypothetical protein
MQQIISIRSISLEHHRVLLVTMPRAHVDVARHLEHDRDLHTHEKKAQDKYTGYIRCHAALLFSGRLMEFVWFDLAALLTLYDSAKRPGRCIIIIKMLLWSMWNSRKKQKHTGRNQASNNVCACGCWRELSKVWHLCVAPH